jgi:hypothetical protein
VGTGNQTKNRFDGIVMRLLGQRERHVAPWWRLRGTVQVGAPVRLVHPDLGIAVLDGVAAQPGHCRFRRGVRTDLHLDEALHDQHREPPDPDGGSG